MKILVAITDNKEPWRVANGKGHWIALYCITAREQLTVSFVLKQLRS